MPAALTLNVNGRNHELNVDPQTPLLYVLRNDLGLKGPKYGCGEEQCGACKVLVDGQAVPSCKLPVANVVDLPVVTVEGLGTLDAPHPLQEAFAAAQAIQCGYCAAGMIIAAQGLLNRVRYPSDDQIREALADNLCRCGIYDRVRRAIQTRTGQRDPAPGYTRQQDDLPAPPAADLLPGPLQQTPQLDDWIRIDEGGTITVFTGKVEYGQGLATALAQIAAEELDVALARVRVVLADTARTPDEGSTVGSMSLETSGNAIRYAAAAARRHLLHVAFEELEARLADLVVNDGTITDTASGRATTYWELFAGRRFGLTVSGEVAPKDVAAHTIVGKPAPRVDLPAKVSGAPVFLHDLVLPGMCYARVVRPPHAQARLRAVDQTPVEQMPGVVAVVRDGSFLAVVARREEQAIAAADQLRATTTWTGTSDLPPQSDLNAYLQEQEGQSFLIVDGAAVDDPLPPLATPPGAARTISATYSRPYQMHASLGPSAAVAWWRGEELTLWVHSQGVFPQRAAIAEVLGMAPEAIRVIYRDGPGCYGHNGADDAALDAALLARALPGHPIALQWSRADEHRWEPYAPPMIVQMQGSLDAAGRVIAWNHDVWSPSHFGRPRAGGKTSGLLAAWHLQDPFPPPPSWPSPWRHSSAQRNADPLYAFPHRRVVKHFVPHSPLRVSSLRSLGAFANVFAIESFMDELAHAAGVDPVTFRHNHLDDPRARAVIDAAVARAGAPPAGPNRGRGLAFARYKNQQTYAAVLVDVAVDREAGIVHLERAIIAADAGQIINPDGLSNQLEGGFVQAASMTLKEEVTFDAGGVTSVDWESYPILRFPEAPVVEVVLLDRPAFPHMGAGEAATGPTPAAIANAICNATGLRLRHIPFTPDRVRAGAAR